jgi:hypothetical protein
VLLVVRTFVYVLFLFLFLFLVSMWPDMRLSELVGVTAILLPRILDVLGSNFDQDTGCHYRWFS